jgi:hypothetical protein
VNPALGVATTTMESQRGMLAPGDVLLMYNRRAGRSLRNTSKDMLSGKSASAGRRFLRILHVTGWGPGRRSAISTGSCCALGSIPGGDHRRKTIKCVFSRSSALEARPRRSRWATSGGLLVIFYAASATNAGRERSGPSAWILPAEGDVDVAARAGRTPHARRALASTAITFG